MPAEVVKTLALVRKDWAQLLEAEQAYAICPDCCTAVVAMLWRLCLPIRAFVLALDSCDYDLESDVGEEALLLLDAMLDILGDSKCIEDTHSHLRYLGAKAKMKYLQGLPGFMHVSLQKYWKAEVSTP